ncbi:hypothetical protein Bp8pS_112 [Bacillus phage vB_BpuM-BpSp]|nr:hypothetical protein Bp8pS_112 [Bacillus phage vB_BpuM-BpSp]
MCSKLLIEKIEESEVEIAYIFEISNIINFKILSEFYKPFFQLIDKYRSNYREHYGNYTYDFNDDEFFFIYKIYNKLFDKIEKEIYKRFVSNNTGIKSIKFMRRETDITFFSYSLIFRFHSNSPLIKETERLITLYKLGEI